MSTVRTSLQEVRGLKDQLRLVVDTIPALAWSARPDGAPGFVSERWLAYTGFSANDAVGWGWTATVHPDDRARFVDEWKAAVAAGEPLEAETRLRRADGEHRWFLIRAVPLRDALGQIAKWYGTATDIEDRKEAEAALARSEEQWKDVFENNPTMCFIVDASGTILLVNLFGAEQLGYTVNELVGQSLLNVYQEADREAAERNVATCLDLRGRAMSWEIRRVRKDRSVLWLRETAKAARRGESPIVLIACEDITDRKRAETALRERASLLDLTHDSVFVRDTNNVITYWNRGAQELYGWTGQEALGKVTHQLLQTIFPAPLDEITAQLQRTGRWEGELVHTKADGTRAISSLPVPVSPWINTVESVGATRSTCSSTDSRATLLPMSCSNLRS
jgi:PAS domain S-box-containing protein